MNCFTAQPRIPTEELIDNVLLEDEGCEITWGRIWDILPGYPLQLSPEEMWWRNRYNMLERRGYQLLPRYSPDWKPSWIKPYDSRPRHTAEKAKSKPDKYEDTVTVCLPPLVQSRG